jgi:hypothetical protein
MKHDGQARRADPEAESDDEMDPLTYRILAGFDRPPRPPAPAPERRASSDGGNFVAYSATVQPPRSRGSQESGALVELSNLITHPTPVPQAPAPRDLPTLVAPRRATGAAIGVLVVVSVVLGGAFVALLAALLWG